MSHSLIVGAYSSGFLLDRSIGSIAGVVAFFALVMRVPVKREMATALGESPKARGLLLRRTWIPTWFVKTPDGWKNLDRALAIVAISGGAVVAVTLALVPLLGRR